MRKVFLGVEIENAGPGIGEDGVDRLGAEIGVSISGVLRDLFVQVDGGKLVQNYIDVPAADLLLVELLPVYRHVMGVVSVCRDYVAQRGAVPQGFVPFVREEGGDYCFVDCVSGDEAVYVHRHDTAFDPMVSLGMDLKGFFKRLTPLRER